MGVRAADDGWVVAARVHDDVLITDRGGERRDVATDHLQLWLGTDDGWVQVAVYPGAEGAEVVPVALARRGEQEGDVPESAAAAVAGVHAAWRPLQDRQGEALGLDLEVAIPASAVRVEGDRFGLRVVYADSDGGATLEGDLCIGNAPPLADAWVRLE